MKLHQLKVRPRKAEQMGPCAAQFANMLACWASSSDMANTGACQESAARLAECMKNQAGRRAPAKPAINYHLARLSKRL